MVFEALGVVLALSAVFTFTLSNAFFRKIEKNISPAHINAFRTAVGAITFFIFTLIVGELGIICFFSARLWFWLLISIAFAQAFGDFFYFQTQKRIGTTKALAISMTFPIFTAILSLIFLEENDLSLFFFLSLTLVISGVLVIVKAREQKMSRGEEKEFDSEIDSINRKPTDELDQEEKIPRDQIIAIGLGFCASISWAIGIVMTKYVLNEITALTGQGQYATTLANTARFPFAVFLLILIGIKDKSPTKITKWDKKIWFWLIVASIIGTSIGAFLYVEATRLAGASLVSLIAAGSPLFSLPLSWIINKERITFMGFGGICLIISGVVLTIIFV